ncbi:hypothetical protein NC651_009377 [Populus alba x Populus x berolinensis]|nr:hypothetical protein NC651_009377 [Populus alba x Populus x berolinensis]
MGWVTLLYVSNPLVDLFSYHSELSSYNLILT